MGTDADGNKIKPTETAGSQDLNCVEELLPPLRLAHLAEIAARNALRRNILRIRCASHWRRILQIQEHEDA